MAGVAKHTILADHVWTMEELIELIELKEANAA
jgi:hypothetical protein